MFIVAEHDGTEARLHIDVAAPDHSTDGKRTNDNQNHRNTQNLFQSSSSFVIKFLIRKDIQWDFKIIV